MKIKANFMMPTYGFTINREAIMQILLADDHDLVRDAIGALLSAEDPAIEVSMAEDVSAALMAMRSKSFDLIVLDLRMPGMNGLVGAQKVMDAAGDAPVMIMSGQANTGDVRAAHRIGIKGFVSKTLAGKSLINAVRLVLTGETYFPTKYFSSKSAEDSDTEMVALTNRETEVLSQLRQGNSNKEIARALDIAETTVKLHVRSLNEKFFARNRTA